MAMATQGPGSETPVTAGALRWLKKMHISINPLNAGASQLSRKVGGSAVTTSGGGNRRALRFADGRRSVHERKSFSNSIHSFIISSIQVSPQFLQAVAVAAGDGVGG